MHDTQPYRRPRQAQGVRQSVPKVRRPAKWRRRITLIGLLVIASLVIGGVLLWQRAVAFNDAVSTESAASLRLFGPFQDSDRINVLLLGYSDESRPGAFLSDSINVISIDPSTDATSIIPIPRDLWVEGVPEVPQNMKMNEALRIGTYTRDLANGAELAAKAVTRVTGLSLDGWITLDFQGFQAMVDAVGGITVENPRAFAYTWSDEDWLAGNFPYSFEAGTLQLDGSQALDYARNRYGNIPEEYGDFARLERQQRVLESIRSRLTGWEALPKGLAMADALEGHLYTSLSIIDLAMLGSKLEADHRVDFGEILVQTTNTLGQFILVVKDQTDPADYGVLHRFIAESLDAPVEAPASSASPPSVQP